MKTPKEKGEELERAVAAIERSILSAQPGLTESTFLMESRKIVEVGGVRHEIDIYVTIDAAPGYQSRFIFECKNWMDAVGKNEIIIFSEKIDATSAQKGFFVAKSFTADAEAQAAKDPRIALLVANERDVADMPIPFEMHFVHVENKHVQVHLRRRGSAATEQIQLDLERSNSVLRGTEADLRVCFVEWAEKARDKQMRTFPSGRLPEGSYERNASEAHKFEPGEFVVDGMDIEQADVSIDFSVHLVRPMVISHFEVATRGRVISLSPIQLANGTVLRASFIGHNEQVS